VSPAADPHLQGADRVREVFARVRNGDASVADLYAEDAVIVYGNGEGDRVEGREAIRAFYQGTIDAIRPRPNVETVLEAPPHFVALVDVPTEDVHHRALDLFEIDERGIRRLEIYTRTAG
jgi:ketosteroid isomerase-like protein